MKSKESNNFERVSSLETSSGDGELLANNVSLLVLHLHVFFLLCVLIFTSVLFAYLFIHIGLSFYLSLDYTYSILLVDTPFRIYCYFRYVKFCSLLLKLIMNFSLIFPSCFVFRPSNTFFSCDILEMIAFFCNLSLLY